MNIAINSLSEFKKALTIPGITIRGLYHYREAEAPKRLAHFLARFKSRRSVTPVRGRYFDIEGGSRLDLTHKAGWEFNGTNEITLRQTPTTHITYVLELPDIQEAAA